MADSLFSGDRGAEVFMPFGFTYPFLRYKQETRVDAAYRPYAEEVLQILVKEIVCAGNETSYQFVRW